MSENKTKSTYVDFRQGQEVKIVSPFFQNRIGTILKYERGLQNYLVVMEDGDTVLPFAAHELKLA